LSEPSPESLQAVKNFADCKLSAVYVNQTNLNVKLSTKLRGPAKNLGGMALPGPPFEPPQLVACRKSPTTVAWYEGFKIYCRVIVTQ